MVFCCGSIGINFKGFFSTAPVDLTGNSGFNTGRGTPTVLSNTHWGCDETFNWSLAAKVLKNDGWKTTFTFLGSQFFPLLC